MKSKLIGVAAEYERGMVDYLRQRSESQLSEASRLGRLAMAEKLGVLDMIMIHHDVLSHLDSAGREDPREMLSASSLFLCETLSSYEMAQRGFQDASESVMRMAQFSLVVCHELRTPLTSIVTSLGMLQEVLAARADSNEGRLISNAIKSAAILKSRTEDLQDLASYRAGILSLKPVTVEVPSFLRSIVSRLEPLAAQAGVTIRQEIPEGLPAISADPNRLDQIVTNIINNALKYAADGRWIDLRAFTRDAMMVIEVKDYGPGFDPSARARLFQQAPRKVEAAGDFTGMGIGLELCRELAEQHGGSITVATEKGKGSMFTVALPLARRIVGHEGSDH
jgi:signal transduction histidine kinase